MMPVRERENPPLPCEEEDVKSIVPNGEKWGGVRVAQVWPLKIHSL